MTVAAPPRPPQLDDATGHDRCRGADRGGQAARARRRRQIYGAVASSWIAAVAAATVAINGSDTTHSEPSGLDTPAAAAATAPTGELVASMHLLHSSLGTATFGSTCTPMDG